MSGSLLVLADAAGSAGRQTGERGADMRPRSMTPEVLQPMPPLWAVHASHRRVTFRQPASGGMTAGKGFYTLGGHVHRGMAPAPLQVDSAPNGVGEDPGRNTSNATKNPAIHSRWCHGRSERGPCRGGAGAARR